MLSPPPTIVKFGDFAMVLATSFVPFANFWNSNTPIGPFQKTVRARCKKRLYIAKVLGPISNPIKVRGK